MTVKKCFVIPLILHHGFPSLAQNKHISLSDELKEFLTSEPSSPQLETRFTQNSMEEASQCRSVMPFNRSRHEVSSQFIELSLQVCYLLFTNVIIVIH